jgi:hypothetical protein
MIGKSKVEFKGIGNLRRPFAITLFSKDWRKSTTRTKSKGERGPPCITPLLQ